MRKENNLYDEVRAEVGVDLSNKQVHDLLWGATCFPFDGLYGERMFAQIREMGDLRRSKGLSAEQAVSYFLARADLATETGMLIAHLRDFGGAWRY